MLKSLLKSSVYLFMSAAVLAMTPEERVAIENDAREYFTWTDYGQYWVESLQEVQAYYASMNYVLGQNYLLATGLIGMCYGTMAMGPMCCELATRYHLRRSSANPTPYVCPPELPNRISEDSIRGLAWILVSGSDKNLRSLTLHKR